MGRDGLLSTHSARMVSGKEENGSHAFFLETNNIGKIKEMFTLVGGGGQGPAPGLPWRLSSNIYPGQNDSAKLQSKGSISAPALCTTISLQRITKKELSKH